jgi:hypothetical protein
MILYSIAQYCMPRSHMLCSPVQYYGGFTRSSEAEFYTSDPAAGGSESKRRPGPHTAHDVTGTPPAGAHPTSPPRPPLALSFPSSALPRWSRAFPATPRSTAPLLYNPRSPITSRAPTLPGRRGANPLDAEPRALSRRRDDPLLPRILHPRAAPGPCLRGTTRRSGPARAPGAEEER